MHLYANTQSVAYNVVFFLVRLEKFYALSNAGLVVSVEFALSLIVLGFLVKLGAAPLHQ